MTETLLPLRKPSFPVGTQFRPRGARHDRLYTVADVHSTFNLAGELVRYRYVCTYHFAGCTVTDYDVAETTIARSLAT